MSIVKRPMRPKHARRRLDLSAMREALADGKIHVKLGVVTARDGSHFALEDDDLLVEVRLMAEEIPVTCRMGACGGGSGQGIWFVPDEGSEVAVLVPDGELSAGPIIVGVLSSGGLPSGVASGVTVIANSSKVLVHDGSGGAAPLPTLAEFKAHTHATGVGPSSITVDPIPGVGPILGTTVLEAK